MDNKLGLVLVRKSNELPYPISLSIDSNTNITHHLNSTNKRTSALR